MGDHADTPMGSKELNTISLDLAGGPVLDAVADAAAGDLAEAPAAAPRPELRFLRGLSGALHESLAALGESTEALLRLRLTESDHGELSAAVAQMTAIWEAQALLEGRLLLEQEAPSAAAFNFKAMLEELVGDRGRRADGHAPRGPGTSK